MNAQKLNDIVALQLGQLIIQVQAQTLQIEALLNKIKELTESKKDETVAN